MVDGLTISHKSSPTISHHPYAISHQPLAIPLRDPKSFNGGLAYPCAIAATSRSVVSMSEMESSGNGDSSGTSSVLRYPPQLLHTSMRRSMRSSLGAAVTKGSPLSPQ